jgi:hypothetical protein
MAHNNITSRTDAAALIPEEVSRDLVRRSTNESAELSLFRRVPVGRAQVRMPVNVIADVEMNIWDEAMPYMTEAVGRTLDSAVFFGTNAPASFPTNVTAALRAAGNNTTEGTAAASGGYMADIDIALGKLEADGYEADGMIAATSFKGKLRSARNAQGDRLDADRVAGDLKTFDGMSVVYPKKRGHWHLI